MQIIIDLWIHIRLNDQDREICTRENEEYANHMFQLVTMAFLYQLFTTGQASTVVNGVNDVNLQATLRFYHTGNLDEHMVEVNRKTEDELLHKLRGSKEAYKPENFFKAVEDYKGSKGGGVLLADSDSHWPSVQGSAEPEPA